MTAAHYIIQYRAADKSLWAEAHTGTDISEIVSQAPLRNHTILAVGRVTITATGMSVEDVSAAVAKEVVDRFADDEDGIPDDWDTLLHRAGLNLEQINGEAAAEAANHRRYVEERAADYRASVR